MSRIARTRPPLAAGPLQASPVYPTVATVLLLIDGWTDLKEKRRDDLKAALAAVVKAAGKPPEALRLDPAELSRGFLETPPAALNVKPSTLTTYKNSVRAVLRRLGLLDRPRLVATPLPPAWAALRDALPDKYLSIRLQGLMAFVAERALQPEQVPDDILAPYLEHLRTRRLCRSPAEQVRRIAAAWNRAGDHVAGWPRVRLQAPGSSRRYSPRHDELAPSLQADLEALRRRLSLAGAEGLFSGDGPRFPRRPASVVTRMVNVRLAIAALMHSGVALRSITSLAVLVEPENLKRIIDWHWRRAGKVKNNHTGTIAETLRVVAKYHVGLGGADLATVAAITRCAKPPKPSRMTPKNEQRLAQLDDEHNLARLLHLPKHLMGEAECLARGKRPQEAAWLAGVAVAVEIELRCPMRLHNLAHLRIGKELVRLDSRRRRFTHFMVAGEDVKNEEAITWPVNPETADLIETYLRDHRPHLAAAGTDWLFPNRDHADRPRKPGGLSFAITDAIWRHVGISMHTHLFRAFAGALLLEENSATIEDLRLILGHRTLSTALAYYASRQPRRAARNLDVLVTRRKAETRPLAAAAFARQTGRPKRRKAS